MKFLFALCYLSAYFSGGFSICTVPTGSEGKVVFQLNPSPVDTLAGLVLPKSFPDIVKALQAANDVSRSLIDKVNFLARLFGLPVQLRNYWISNEVYCDGCNNIIISIVCAFFSFIADIRIPITIPIPLPPKPSEPCESIGVDGRPWGIAKVGAPETWAKGFNGAGIRVANIDTGVRGTHKELRDNRCEEDFWLDPTVDATTEPTDSNGHGTHVMGTIAGNTVGVAPGACWMACRACTTSSCEEEYLIACGQFLACPNLDNDCATKPHVINYSLGGTPGDTTLDPVLETWRIMGIASFAAAGNKGPKCRTLTSFADHNPAKYSFLSVGATMCNDTIANFSSTGPSKMEGYDGGLGVHIVAPGRDIRSAAFSSDTDYKNLKGTSMATPHVTGAAAVLLSKKLMTPAELNYILTSTANRDVPIYQFTACNGSNFNPWKQYPNNVYGYGRLDLLAAIRAVS